MPTFGFREWLVGLTVGCGILICLSALAYCGATWLRPLARGYAAIMLVNGLGHTLFTVLGHTVASVSFPRPAPGFYSSPFLLVASVWMFIRLRQMSTRQDEVHPALL
jgi:hypothetical protein